MNTTIIFMLLFVLTAAIFDVWVIATRSKYESISAHTIRLSKKYPLVVLLTGILLGHLFWNMDTFDVLFRPELIERCKEYVK